MVNDKEHVTGEGDAFKIFGSVFSVVKEFISRYPETETIKFAASGQEPSRVRLYRTLVRVLVGEDWIPSEKWEGNDLYFTLSRS